VPIAYRRNERHHLTAHVTGLRPWKADSARRGQDAEQRLVPRTVLTDLLTTTLDQPGRVRIGRPSQQA